MNDSSALDYSVPEHHDDPPKRERVHIASVVVHNGKYGTFIFPNARAMDEWAKKEQKQSGLTMHEWLTRTLFCVTLVFPDRYEWSCRLDIVGGDAPPRKLIRRYLRMRLEPATKVELTRLYNKATAQGCARDAWELLRHYVW